MPRNKQDLSKRILKGADNYRKLNKRVDSEERLPVVRKTSERSSLVKPRLNIWSRVTSRENANKVCQMEFNRKTFVPNPGFIRQKSVSQIDYSPMKSGFSKPKGKTANMSKMLAREDNMMYNLSVLSNLR